MKTPAHEAETGTPAAELSEAPLAGPAARGRESYVSGLRSVNFRGQRWTIPQLRGARGLAGLRLCYTPKAPDKSNG